MKTLLVDVIGPAGHGKTGLVRRLAGAGGGAVDLRDPDDHEGRVRALASGTDAVLLAVDAREGLTAQAVELLEIARLIGPRRGVVALTKADLADPETLATGRAAVAAAAIRAGLDRPAPVVTSAETGEGIAALAAALTALVDEGPAHADDGFPYLAVDTVRGQPGAGIAVTGILRRGPLAVGDRVASLPGGATATVRGLEVRGRRVDRAEPGRPTAVALDGPAPDAVTPGEILAPPGLLAGSRRIDVLLTAGTPLASGTAYGLLVGTAAVPVRLRLLDREVLEPGEQASAQLQAEAELALPARAPLLLRAGSPAVTAAGGWVLDPVAPRHERHDPRALSDLAALARGDLAAILATRLGRAGAAGTSLAELARLAGVAPERARSALDAMDAREVGGRFLGAAAVAALRESLLATLGRHHRDHPAEQGLPVERILRLLGLDAAVAGAALDDLVAAGAVARTGALYRRAEFDAARGESEAARRLEGAFRRAGLSPPDEAEAVGRDPRRREALAQLVAAGTVIRAIDRVQRRAVLFHRDAIRDARGRLARAFPNATAPETGFLAREAGAALGISRKFSIPLLEHLDAAGFTRRAGDRRTIIGEP